MDFVAQNWFYMLMLALFVGMHLTGFGCGHRRSRVHKTGAAAMHRPSTGRPGAGRVSGDPNPKAARDRPLI